jgi:hypothetical protein
LAREEDQISAANYFSGDQFRVDVSHWNVQNLLKFQFAETRQNVKASKRADFLFCWPQIKSILKKWTSCVFHLACKEIPSPLQESVLA